MIRNRMTTVVRIPNLLVLTGLFALPAIFASTSVRPLEHEWIAYVRSVTGSFAP